MKPRVLVFTLNVHFQGDGINGASHFKGYPSTITIDGCATDPMKIVTPWTQDRNNLSPQRKKEVIQIPDFKIDNPYCPFDHYELLVDT